MVNQKSIFGLEELLGFKTKKHELKINLVHAFFIYSSGVSFGFESGGMKLPCLSNVIGGIGL